MRTLTTLRTEGQRKRVVLFHGRLPAGTVKVAYADPSASDAAAAIQDPIGNDVASFTTGQGGVPVVGAGTTELEACNTNDALETLCAELTVGAGTVSGVSIYGYNAGASRGSLSPASFAYRIATIGVSTLEYRDETGGELQLTITRSSGATPSAARPGAGRCRDDEATGPAPAAPSRTQAVRWTPAGTIGDSAEETGGRDGATPEDVVGRDPRRGGGDREGPGGERRRGARGGVAAVVQATAGERPRVAGARGVRGGGHRRACGRGCGAEAHTNTALVETEGNTAKRTDRVWKID